MVVQRVDGAHAWVSPSGCSCVATGDSAGDGCSPAFSSQIAMTGTNFANSVYSSAIAANVEIMMTISTGRGRYCPHEYGRYLWLSDGTTMRNRSSHMPTTTVHEAMTHPATVRSFL